MVSFCYYDLTRLKVDAIVNSANSALKATKEPSTLNNAIHKAAGPELTKEAKSKGRLKSGQVELTHGFNLPCAWVIHASRPLYSLGKGMGQFNILTECYRSALKMAHNYEFKSIAFPCLGAGGSGFPSRVAARIALQEVREYLDAHPNHVFERLVFCVNTAADEKAYMDFFPVFFPPTHGDLDRARTSNFSANRAALAAQALETRTQVQRVNSELSAGLSLVVKVFNRSILDELNAIDYSLASIRNFLLSPEELYRSMGDLNLICSVLQTLCGSVTEIIEMAKDTAESGHSQETFWAEYNQLMKHTYGSYLDSLLVDCRNFVQSLDDIITRDGAEKEDMAAIRQKLESYGSKQKGQDAEGIRDHLDEVLYTREFQRETVSSKRDIIRLHQILSVARLYQLGQLEAKPTLAHPSELFNHVVCLAREDITQLEVDIMVNSTDISFLGMGTLDRLVFKQGGPELRDQVVHFGRCQEGDVKLTPGYKLPAKHILHVVPPQQYRQNTKDVLRGIYREVLHTAMLMRATSLAIPSIGTGVLNYPRRDCASLALEEVKRFLESAGPTSLIEKIVFVVYSSNDEFIYKSLLPIYFPPKDLATQNSPALRSVETRSEVSSSRSPQPPEPPRRTLFKTIGNAVRGVLSSSRQTRDAREITWYEEHALIMFESHAKICPTCKDITGVYAKGEELCETGYSLAQTLLWYMNMVENQEIQSKPDKDGDVERLEVSPEIFPLSLEMLRTVEKSFRDKNRSKPFVSPNRRALVASQDQTQERINDGDATTTVLIDEMTKGFQNDPPVAALATNFGPSRESSPKEFTEQLRAAEGSHPQGAQRLRELQAQLVSREQREGRLSPLQSRLQDLAEASDKIGTNPASTNLSPSRPAHDADETTSKHSAASDDHIAASGRTLSGESSPLATQILVYLATDLRSRPGSYIGQTTENIALALGKSDVEVSTAIEELAAPGKVHNTINGQTWVLSQPPTELPTLSGSVDDTARIHSTQSRDAVKSTISIARVLSIIEDARSAPGSGGGQTVREVAAALQMSTAEIWPLIRALVKTGHIERSPSNEEVWMVTAKIPHERPQGDEDDQEHERRARSSARSSVRDATPFGDTPPSPTALHAPHNILTPAKGVDFSTLNIDDYFTYSTSNNTRWTRIDKRLVDADVLKKAEEEFDETEDSVIIHRHLRRGDIRRWADQTRALRNVGQTSVGAEDGGENSSRLMKTSQSSRDGWRDGRGEKDRKQAKLDRVLAGDMVEDELRHYADQDNDRKLGREEQNR